MKPTLLLLIVILQAAGTADAAEWGRLFHTPAERAALDKHAQRHNTHQVGQVSTPGTRSPKRVHVDGVISNRHGPRITWINGQMKWAGMRDDGASTSHLLDNGRVRVKRALPSGTALKSDANADGDAASSRAHNP